ncbi:MAG TPA: response regulator [Kofleriaceae bacterium]|nr:response regulator [Kofleriaceae bacterium]
MGDAGLDADDLQMLQTLLRDEAHESLENVAGILMAAPAGGPSQTDIAELLRQTHSLKGAAGTVGLLAIAQATHALEEKFARLRARVEAWSDAVRDELVCAVDGLRTLVDSEVGEGGPASGAGSISGSAPVGGPGSISGPGSFSGSGSLGGRNRARAATETSATLPAPVGEDRREPVDRRQSDLEILRIAASRIDELMDTVGELAITRTRLARHARNLTEVSERSTGEIKAALATLAAAITSDVDALQGGLDALQDGLARTRMMPFRSLYRQLALQLRQLCRSAGVHVDLHTSGEDIEIDKVVAARVADPLIQLLRNAIAHGIEPRARRGEAGKPARGTITLSARHEGRQVAIEVTDDGAGIDPAALRELLVRGGTLSAAQAKAASDDQIVAAIFEPGVTSRAEADQLSGRGVGLDMVRATIAKLGGEISVRSTLGVGTTFSIKLPFTAVLAKALLFKAGGEVMAVFDAYVAGTAEVKNAPVLPAEVTCEGERVPLVDLHAALAIARPAAAASLGAVVLSFAGRRLAFSCDRVIGPREIVVKDLGPLLAPLALFVGGTVSGSGKVQLILDPAALTALALASHGDASAAGRRVLVADDSVTARAGVARALARAGFAVDTAEDGGHAWEMLARKTYDAVVTDIDMPALTGLELLARIRDTAKLSSLPVIVISASATPEAEILARRLGVRAIFAKPVAARHLIAALTQG